MFEEAACLKKIMNLLSHHCTQRINTLEPMKHKSDKRPKQGLRLEKPRIFYLVFEENWFEALPLIHTLSKKDRLDGTDIMALFYSLLYQD